MIKTKKGSTLLKFAVLCIALQNNAMGCATPALAAIGNAFPDAGYQLVSMITTLPPLFMAIVPLFYTPMIRHMKKRTILWICSVLFMVGGLGPGIFHDNIYLILLFRMIIGLAVGVYTILSIDLIVDFFDGKVRDDMTGWSTAFNGIGGVVFQSLGGWLAGIQWYYCFFAILLSIVFLAIPLIFMPEPDRNSKLELEKKVIGAEKVNVKLPGGVWVFGFFVLLHWMFFYIFITNGSIILLSEGIATQAQIGIVYSMTTIGTIILAAIFGKVFAKASYTVISIGMLLGTVALLISATAQTLVLYLLSGLLLGCCTGFVMPGLTSKNNSLVPYANGSKAVSITFFMVGIGGFVSPFIFNNLGLDSRGQCFLGAILYAVCAVIVFVLNRFIKPKADYNLSVPADAPVG